jgi:hypothetical protein
VRKVANGFIMKCSPILFLVIAALVLATPTFAQVPPSTSGDPGEAGSVVVFPKFLKGMVVVDGVGTPATEIEVGLVCPKGATCPEHQIIKIRFHWVCPGTQDFASMLICRENSFDVFGSVNGKVVFNPSALTIAGSNVVTVPQAPCDIGYLIGWVIDPANDKPVKFDGLTGDAVIRETGITVSEYGAFPIQADPALPNFPADGSAIATGTDLLTGTPTLIFDGGPGHYQQIAAAKGTADTSYDKPMGSPVFRNTSLILLALDVRSNRPNYPIFVDLDFSNERGFLLSTSREFVCWTQVRFSDVSKNLTQALEDIQKVFVVSRRAVKAPYIGISDTPGPVTLLGLVQSNEGGVAESISRAYVTIVAKDAGAPKGTVFVPF